MPSNKDDLIRLLAEIEYRREQTLEKEASPYPRNQPIASDLGECAREYVLAVTHWKDKPAFEPNLVARLQRGRLIEDAALRELSGLGIRVRTERTPFELKDKQGRVVLRGKLDGFVEWERHEYPMEIKSVNPMMFPRLHTVEDMQKSPWMQKWPRQLWSYLYGTNGELGFFLLDDCLGHWRLVPVDLNYEEMERILQRCETAVDHLARQTLPDFHGDAEVCRRCWAFGRVCFPPVDHPGMAFTDNPELEAQLDRRAELDPAYREYQDLDEIVKGAVKGKDGLVIGKWLVTGKEIHPKPVPPKPGYTPNPYWKSKFELLLGPVPLSSGPTPSQPPAEAKTPELAKGEIASPTPIEAPRGAQAPAKVAQPPDLTQDKAVWRGKVEGLRDKLRLQPAEWALVQKNQFHGSIETASVEQLAHCYAYLSKLVPKKRDDAAGGDPGKC